MNTAICCIVKCENSYLQEWTDYHFNLGFSHIYIYDNNTIDGEQILSSVADDERVTVIDCRGKLAYQNAAYTDFYKQYGHEYDWVAFIDLDEFITFSDDSGIQTMDDFLGRFDSRVDIIHLNWMCFGDNGIVDLRNDYSVLNRFTEPLDYDKQVQYDFPENNHVKSIMRGGMDIGSKMITVHTPKDLEVSVVDAKGQKCENDYFKPYDFSVAYIRHFVTKTIVEWLIKKSRGRVAVASSTEYYSFERFFLYNERTEEKEKIIQLFRLCQKALSLSAMTEVLTLEKKLDYSEKQLAHVTRDYQVVLHSKAYRIGRLLLHPFKEIKKWISI